MVKAKRDQRTRAAILTIIVIGCLAVAPVARASNASLFADLTPGSSGTKPYSIVPVGGSEFFFIGDDPSNGTELWHSDGTPAGTAIARDIVPGAGGSDPDFLTRYHGNLLFAATDPARGTELWSSDGTRHGTRPVADIVPGPESSYPESLTRVGDRVFLTVASPANGMELWRTNGTAAGTRLVRDINPGPANSIPTDLTAVNKRLYFFVDEPIPGLWRSNGTESGTFRVPHGVPGSYLTNVRGTAYYSGFSERTGQELWRSDGTHGGTGLVRDIRPGGGDLDSSRPEFLANVHGKLFFQANDGTHGTELWDSDGTKAGTRMVRDVWPGSGGAQAAYITASASKAFYVSVTAAYGPELWRSDGTARGTQLVRDIAPGGADLGRLGSSDPHSLVNVHGTLFFAANDRTRGMELWRATGSPPHAGMVRGIRPGPAGSRPASLSNVDGTLFFAANDGIHGAELWTATP